MPEIRFPRRPSSLRGHLLALSFAVALPLVVLQVWSVARTYELSRTVSEQEALKLADVTAASTRQFISDTERLLTNLAQEYGADLRTKEGCARVLSAAGPIFTSLANLLSVDARGGLMCSASALPAGAHANWADREWFQDAVTRRTFVVGTPLFGNITGRWVVALAVPLVNETGEVAGVLAGSVDLARFQELLSGVQLGDGSIVTISDEDARVVARSVESAEHVGRRLPEETDPEESLGAGRSLTRAAGMDGVDRLWAKVLIPEFGWRVYAGIPLSEIRGPVFAQALRAALVTLLGFLVAFAMGRHFHRGIAGSMDRLLLRVRTAEAGDPWTDVDQGPPEVRELGEAFRESLAARDEAEASRRRALERYRSIVDRAVFGIYLATPDGRFLEVNPALAAMLGYDGTEELKRAGPAALYRSPETRRNLVDHHIALGVIKDLEVEWLRKDGTPITVRLNGSLVDTEQGERAFEVIAEDITEARQMEEELRQTQRMEAVGRLAGGIAHDFNNLLTVIGGHADLLQNPTGSGEGEGAREISEAVTRAQALTRQLLEFSRRAPAEAALFHPNDQVTRMEGMLRRLIGEHIRLRTRLAPHLPPVHMDPTRFDQILMNLAVNARDAMPEGGDLLIETSSAVPPGEGAEGAWVCLAIQDTGSGIDPRHRPHIFEPFYTTKGQGEGTGLGLATVYGIVQGAGGTIVLSDRYSGGARFEVFLPASTEVSPVPPEPGFPDEAPVERASGTILVVEDEAPVRRLIQRVLEGAGYNVLLAANGAEGLATAGAHDGELDLVISDVVMPVMKGPAMAQELRRTRPDVPILFVSGYTDDVLSREAIARDPGSFLAKPFAPGELRRRVRTILAAGDRDAVGLG